MLDEIRDVQASVWISASAGTGKTKSLIDRILALLLSGVAPRKILCLTYTKAAATEMLTRLGALVRRFSEMEYEDLRRELRKMEFEDGEGTTKPGEWYAKRARKLYQKSLISSEWVQIKTIHSFCFGILQKFPLETGLMPGASICSDRERNQLLEEAVEAVIFRDDCRKFSKTVARCTPDISDSFEMFNMKLRKFFAKFDNFEEIYTELFGVKWNDSESDDSGSGDTAKLDEKLINEVFGGNARGFFMSLAESLSGSKKSESQLKEILLNNVEKPSADFLNAFFTKEGKLRSGLSEKMQEGLVKAQEFLRKKVKYESIQANIAFFSLVRKILDEFDERKRTKHYIDYDDIIIMTSSLLNNIDWVMFKIDNSIDHVLIDEAQDTSPEQWEIICKITDEFFNNFGSERTVFVVGDEKQSIYSFQGADVKVFQKMHELFEARSKACGQRFHNVQLNKSYRTTGNILRFVDEVFEGTYMRTQHSTNRAEDAGEVYVAELFEGGEEENIETESDEEKDTNERKSADEKLARHLAEFIKGTIDSGRIVEARGRPAKPEDFMILFQRRDTEAMQAIARALEDRGVPVSGMDRLLLKDEVIVEDLITLAKFAVFPLDDLLCARVLKSPVVGIGEDELMCLCLERGDKGLWEYCLENEKLYDKHDVNAVEKDGTNEVNEADTEDSSEKLKELKDLMNQGLQTSAYVFFTKVLTKKMKEGFAERLGEISMDPLGDFMDVVEKYESENTASLQSFLEWFDDFGEKIEIKRDAFASPGCVRIMTVHASKGLQAPFVLLADTHFYNAQSGKILATNKDGILVWGAAVGAGIGIKVGAGTNNSGCYIPDVYVEAKESAKAASEEESLRELYVALTRAEDYVGIFGRRRKDGKQVCEKCWYRKIRNVTEIKKRSRIGLKVGREEGSRSRQN